jgi:dihydroxyacid dehydratase/phosphogluconate dehydratase
MAAATVNIPAISMNVGPMLNGMSPTDGIALIAGYAGKQLIGSGAIVWDSRKLFAEGKLNEAQMMQRVALSAPSYVSQLDTR